MKERGFKWNSIQQFNKDFYEDFSHIAKVGDLMYMTIGGKA